MKSDAKSVRHSALCLALLLVVGGQSVRAETGAISYSPGDKVEFHFGARPWQPGVVTKNYPASNQVVVRDATGYEQAYSFADVRHPVAATSVSAAGGQHPSGETQLKPNSATTLVAPGKIAVASPATGTWRAGDKVSVVVSGGCCYDGTVVRAGVGEWAGYMIQFDDGSHQQYAAARYVRHRGAGKPAISTSGPPRKSGRRAGCQIMTIGNKPVCVPS